MFLILFKSIYKKIFFQGSYKQKNILMQTSFCHDKQYGFFQACKEILYLPKWILITDGTIAYVKKGALHLGSRTSLCITNGAIYSKN